MKWDPRPPSLTLRLQQTELTSLGWVLLTHQKNLNGAHSQTRIREVPMDSAVRLLSHGKGTSSVRYCQGGHVTLSKPTELTTW